KQWEKVEKIDAKEAIVKTPMRYGLVETTHPSYQAWSYASLIRDYNETIQQEDIELHPCAYLHNYIIQEKTDPLIDPIYSYYIESANIYVKDEAKKIKNNIKKHIKYGDKKETLNKIEKRRIRQAK